MMRNRFTVSLLITLLLALVVLQTGCGFFAQPGETVAEGHRRHRQMLRVNNQEMMSDIDRALLLDKPSKLTEKKVP